MNLKELEIGSKAVISNVGCIDITLKQHILDMGLTPGTEVVIVKTAPMGDPLELRVRGYELTLRKADAEYIEIIEGSAKASKPLKVESYSTSGSRKHSADIPHPQTGEMSLEHLKQRRSGHIIPEGKEMTFALVGNQNCGKTTLFNQLTGSNQHVGNFPGVTVDRKDGVIIGYPDTVITDLPGIYSLLPYTSEEKVTRSFLLDNRPDGIINILDATNIERNLYLTMQLIELDIPMVIALNMMDEVMSNGGAVKINFLEKLLGVPVIPISAIKNEGITELTEHAVHVAKYGERPMRLDFCDPDDSGDGGAVHRCIHAIIHLLEDHAKAAEIPVRFAATKIVEGDILILGEMKLEQNELDTLEHIINQLEQESGCERQAALADMRFSFIEKVCGQTVVKPHESNERKRSKKIDRLLTGKYTAFPSFVAIMCLIFWLTFAAIGDVLSNLMEMGINWFIDACDALLTNCEINEVVHSLIIDGIFTGVGSVLSFLPIIVVLFFFLSILEDSGYMARVAFIMDRPLRKTGLSGRSFVPMLIGFGCSVPAIMATRTLPSERDRRMTIMLTPFMSCSAKLPIYALFTAAFFPKYGILVMLGMYLTGILIAIISALCLKKTIFRGSPVPFVMELPNYRMPALKNVMKLIFEKARDFITKAFTVIFIASIIIWFLQTFDGTFNVVKDPQDSLLASIGSVIAPVFSPLGFGDWRVSTSLITGFAAKESVVSTLTVLTGGSTAALGGIFSPCTAIVFLVFTLLYTPCVAAIAAVRRELGRKWACEICAMQCVIAWIAAFVVHFILMLAGLV